MSRKNPDSLKPAALQGFDDGYFRNDEQYDFETEAERAAYDTEFAIGRKQRIAETRNNKTRPKT